MLSTSGMVCCVGCSSACFSQIGFHLPASALLIRADMWSQPLRVDYRVHWVLTVCRDAASCELELSTLEDVQKGLEAACFGAGGQDIYGPLADAVARTAAWLKARAERPDVRPEPGSSRRFEGVWASLEVGSPAQVHAAVTVTILRGGCTAGCLNMYARTSA